MKSTFAVLTINVEKKVSQVLMIGRFGCNGKCWGQYLNITVRCIKHCDSLSNGKTVCLLHNSCLDVCIKTQLFYISILDFVEYPVTFLCTCVWYLQILKLDFLYDPIARRTSYDIYGNHITFI